MSALRPATSATRLVLLAVASILVVPLGCSDLSVPAITPPGVRLTTDDVNVLAAAVQGSHDLKVQQRGQLVPQNTGAFVAVANRTMRVCGRQSWRSQLVACLPVEAVSYAQQPHSSQRPSLFEQISPSLGSEFLARNQHHVRFNTLGVDVSVVPYERALSDEEWWAVVVGRMRQTEPPNDLVLVTLPVYGHRTAVVYLERLSGREPAWGWFVRLTERSVWQIDSHTVVWTSHPEG